MKIVILAEVLGESNNGTTIAAYNLINYLKEQGHDVQVICPDLDKQDWAGYHILETKHFIWPINKILAKNGVSLAKFNQEIIYEAVKDADIVHCMVPLFMARKATNYIKSLGIPLTAGFHAQAENLTAHLGMLRFKWVNHLVYKWYDKNVFDHADGIHYPTKFIKYEFEKEIKRDTPGYVISNGVNDLFKPLKIDKPVLYKDKFVILFIGRLSTEKRHLILLKAVAKSKYKDSIQLIFAGSGPKEKKIKRYAKHHLTIQPRIEFMNRSKLVETINYSDIYCHPSYAEIEAISCLEAISCGLVPLIANSKKSATKDFANDSRCLFNVDDSDDLANKIDYFIEHPFEKEKLKQKYLKQSFKYDQRFCMRQMENMFFDVLRKTKKGK